MKSIKLEIEQQLQKYKEEERLIFQLQHNLINEEEGFVNNLLQHITKEEIIDSFLDTPNISSEVVRNIYKQLVQNQEEEKIFNILQHVVNSLKKLENNFLQIKYINSLNIFLILLEEDFVQTEFSKEFYQQIVKLLKENFSTRLGILLMNINYELMFKLQQYNNLLNEYPPTKTIKQLRLIEYVQNYLLMLEQLKQNKITKTKIVTDYGYMLKVIKNNRKELIKLEQLEDYLVPNVKLSFISQDNYLGFKKVLNPNYEEKLPITNQEEYLEITNFTKQILLEYNKINGIKGKKRKKKNNV